MIQTLRLWGPNRLVQTRKGKHYLVLLLFLYLWIQCELSNSCITFRRHSFLDFIFVICFKITRVNIPTQHLCCHAGCKKICGTSDFRQDFCLLYHFFNWRRSAISPGIHWRLVKALHPSQRTGAAKPEWGTRPDCHLKRNKAAPCWFCPVVELQHISTLLHCRRATAYKHACILNKQRPLLCLKRPQLLSLVGVVGYMLSFVKVHRQ